MSICFPEGESRVTFGIDWIDLKFDTQVLGAVLQVIAAGIVAFYVQGNLIPIEK
jgi:hypothetical protein